MKKKKLEKIRKRKGQKYFCGRGHGMIGWVKGPKIRRLVRTKPNPKLEPKSEPKLKEMAQERSFSDIFYLPRRGPSVIFL